MADNIADLGFNVSTRGLAQGESSMGSFTRSGRAMEAGVVGNTEAVGAGFAALSSKAAMLTTVLAAVGATSVFKSMIEETKKSEENLLKINALLESTGKSSQITGELMRDSAESFALGTLASVEGVQEAQAIMLTFKGIAVDSFDATTEAALNLSAVTGQGVTAAMTQLGKALDNPITGMSAMSRSGVTFTQDQKNMAKALYNSGDALGAQTIILDELAAQYGGAARAAAAGLSGAEDTLGQSIQTLTLSMSESLDVSGNVSSAYGEMSDMALYLAENTDELIDGAEAFAGVLTAAMVPGLIKAGIATSGATISTLAYNIELARMSGLTGSYATKAALATIATNGLAAATKVLMGPWGLLAAAVTVGIGSFVSAQSEAKKLRDELDLQKESVSNLTDSYKKMSGAAVGSAAIQAQTELIKLDQRRYELNEQLASLSGDYSEDALADVQYINAQLAKIDKQALKSEASLTAIQDIFNDGVDAVKWTGELEETKTALGKVGDPVSIDSSLEDYIAEITDSTVISKVKALRDEINRIGDLDSQGLLDEGIADQAIAAAKKEIDSLNASLSTGKLDDWKKQVEGFQTPLQTLQSELAKVKAGLDSGQLTETTGVTAYLANLKTQIESFSVDSNSVQSVIDEITDSTVIGKVASLRVEIDKIIDLDSQGLLEDGVAEQAIAAAKAEIDSLNASLSTGKLDEWKVQVEGFQTPLQTLQSELAKVNAGLNSGELTETTGLTAYLANLRGQIESFSVDDGGLQSVIDEITSSTKTGQIDALNQKIELLRDLLDNGDLSITIGTEAIEDAKKEILSLQGVVGDDKSYEDMANSMSAGFSSLQSMGSEGTSAYAALGTAAQAFNAVAAVSAILTQGEGDPYTAFARMASMAALVSNLGVSTGSVSSNSSASRQESQGTDTFGNDYSSIEDSLDITADATSDLVGINTNMLDALNAMQSGIDTAAASSAIDLSGIDMKWFVTDAGINFDGGNLGDLAQDSGAEVYNEAWGKYVATTDSSDTTGDLYSTVFASIVDSVTSAGEDLGLSSEYLQNAVNGFNVEAFKISLKGLDEEAAAEEVSAVFSELLNSVSSGLVDYLPEFNVAGEELGATLSRLANEVNLLNYSSDTLGFSLGNLTDNSKDLAGAADNLTNMLGGTEEFNAGISSFMSNFASDATMLDIYGDAITESLSEVGLTVPATTEAMWDLIGTLSAADDANLEQIATLLEVSDTASEYYDLLEDSQAEALSVQEDLASQIDLLKYSSDALGFSLGYLASNSDGLATVAEGMAEILGGTDEFDAGISSFLSNFASDSVMLGIYSDSVSESLNAVGLELPATAEAMWNLVGTLSAADDANAEQIATLLEVSDTAASYYNLLETSQASALSAQESMASLSDTFADAAMSIYGVSDGMSQVSLDAALAAAKMGDFSLAEMLDTSDYTLDTDDFSSAADFNIAQAVAANKLLELSELAADQSGDVETQQLDTLVAINNSIIALQQRTDELLTMQNRIGADSADYLDSIKLNTEGK